MHRKTAVFATVILVLCVSPILASGARTFVSSTGNDANTCGRTDPCRSFAAALLQTTNNGEVVPLDSAGYGTMTITQPVSVITPLGIHAAITAGGGTDGVIVNTPQFTSVALRNLYINSGGGNNGISMTSGGTLHIEHCLVSGFSGTGIRINPTTDVMVIITDTLVRQNSTAGISSSGGAHSTLMTIDHCHIEKGGFGVLVDQVAVTVSNTTADGNSAAGFQARGNDEFTAIVVDSCVASHNNTGFLVNSGSLVAHNSTAVNNTTGFYTLGGNLEIDGGSAAFNQTGIDVNAAVASVRGCQVADNFNFGVHVQNFGSASVTGNIIIRNDTGLDCTGATAVDSAGDNVISHNNTNNVVCAMGSITKV